MAIETRIERSVSDVEPDGLGTVKVSWADDAKPYLVLAQDSDVIHLYPEHAKEVAQAMLAALSEREAAAK